MTWGEFKTLVEAAGVLDTDQVEYIDVIYPEEKRMEIYRDEAAQALVVHD